MHHQHQHHLDATKFVDTLAKLVMLACDGGEEEEEGVGKKG